MKKQALSKMWLICGIIGVVTFAAVIAGLGAYLGSRLAQQQSQPDLAPLILKASTASKGKSVSIATGFIDGSTEGLFVLDHSTGMLQCTYPNPRDNSIAGVFTADVARDLGNEQGGQADYVLVTGSYAYDGRQLPNNQTVASSICYVAETNSGKIVAYKISVDLQKVRRFIQQKGVLVPSPPFRYRTDDRRDQ